VEWSCSISRMAGGDAKADAYANTSPSYSSALSPAKLFGQDATYTLRMRFNAAGVACDIAGDAGDRAQATAPIATAVVPGYLAVFTTAAAARVHYLAVYSAM